MAYSQGAGSCPQGAGSATEANALAVETPDLRERDLLFEIADQWRFLAAHRAVNKQTVLKLVTDKPPSRPLKKNADWPALITSAHR